MKVSESPSIRNVVHRFDSLISAPPPQKKFSKTLDVVPLVAPVTMPIVPLSSDGYSFAKQKECANAVDRRPPAR